MVYIFGIVDIGNFLYKPGQSMRSLDFAKINMSYIM